jgi:Asp/Glu/hydantoin racemase
MKMTGGFTNYGQDIGVLMLDTSFPRPPGDIGNARSYDFPVRYKTVRGAVQSKIMGHAPDAALIEPFIAAARELERDGVGAITTSCGFLTPFQKQLAAAVNIPVFVSALIQAPLIHAMLPPGRKIGVFTERAQFITESHFQGVGWSSRDIPVHVKGMKPDAVFPQVYIGNANELDTDILTAEMVEMARAFMAECPEAGAILFECTNMCPFSHAVREATDLPVFDINTMINWFWRARNPVRYLD